MPRTAGKPPSYRKQKASGKAVVTLHGKDHYLPGRYGSPESWVEYHRLLAIHTAERQQRRLAASRLDPTAQP